MIDALYCRSTAVLLAMHVWLYVVDLAVLYQELRIRMTQIGAGFAGYGTCSEFRNCY